ncbi:hypothetical protein ACRRTK_005694 [Alexandromys fortis]
MLKFKAFCLDYWQFLCLQPLHGAYKSLDFTSQNTNMYDCSRNHGIVQGLRGLMGHGWKGELQDCGEHRHLQLTRSQV